MSGFNIDDYLNDPDFENKLENYREKMILEAIEHNFENIKKNNQSLNLEFINIKDLENENLKID